jgi:hypothetical protein
MASLASRQDHAGMTIGHWKWRFLSCPAAEASFNGSILWGLNTEIEAEK